MSTAKIAISLDTVLLEKLDDCVKYEVFKNRSQAIQTAIRYIINKMEHQRLAHECAKLDPAFERKLAEEGLYEDYKEWPKY
jgi:metal-responsive CopG/Arc/MetJ family transcriptional regulator